MNKHFLAATALCSTLGLLVPGTVLAQSAPVDWSGFYFGGGIGIVDLGGDAEFDFSGDGVPGNFDFEYNDGYVADNTDAIDPIDCPPNCPQLLAQPSILAIGDDGRLPSELSLDHRGVLGTLGAGYNFQSGQFVYGVEADFSLLAGRQSVSVTGPSSGPTNTVSAEAELGSLATARARAGIAVDRMLFFATAGLAAGEVDFSAAHSYQDGAKGFTSSGSTSQTALGFVAGAGAEFAANDNISLKAEALYYQLGSVDLTATGSGTGSGGSSATVEPFSASYTPSGVIVRTGLNFRF